MVLGSIRSLDLKKSAKQIITKQYQSICEVQYLDLQKEIETIRENT